MNEITLVQAAHNNQTCMLDDPLFIWGGREEFVDARDCARANVCALFSTHLKQRVYNIASGEWFTLREFVQTMQQVLPQLKVNFTSEPESGFAGFPHQRPSPSNNEAAKLEMSFHTSHSLKASMAYWCEKGKIAD